jgi:hypothetical protein
MRPNELSAFHGKQVLCPHDRPLSLCAVCAPEAEARRKRRLDAEDALRQVGPGLECSCPARWPTLRAMALQEGQPTVDPDCPFHGHGRGGDRVSWGLLGVVPGLSEEDYQKYTGVLRAAADDREVQRPVRPILPTWVLWAVTLAFLVGLLIGRVWLDGITGR